MSESAILAEQDRGRPSMVSVVERWLLPLGIFFLALAYMPGIWMSHHYGKWLAVYALAFPAAALLLLWRPVAPAFRPREALALLFLFVAVLAHLFSFHGYAYAFSLSDRLAFLFLCWFSWRAFTAGIRWEDLRVALAATLFVVCAVGLWQAANRDTSLLAYHELSSTFGHANQAAQFAGLALLALWSLPWPKGRGLRALMLTVSFPALLYLFLSGARSALLALALGTAVLLVLRWRGRYRGARWLLAAFVCVLALFLAIRFSPLFPKASMLDYRLDLWRQTGKMILHHPWGVGVDRFPFAFLPYHREGHTLSPQHLALSPHNEFLRYLAEDGWALALLFAFALVWFYRLWWRRGGEGRELVLPLSAFYLVEMAVQFPWQNPFPVFFGAMLFGSMAAAVWPPRSIAGGQWGHFARPAVLLLLAGIFLQAGAARVLERSPNLALAQLACRAVPSHWPACLHYSRMLEEKGDRAAARKVAQALLEREPNNYRAIRHLAVFALRSGDTLYACFLTWRYDDIFGGKSDLHEAYVKNCPKRWREYFDRRRPQQYRREGISTSE